MIDWITVCSANVSKRVAGDIKPNSIVSILGKNCMSATGRRWHWDSMSRRTSKLLPLEFDDIDNEWEVGIGRGAPLILPQRLHIQRIIRFAQETEGTMLLHCWAGISRSGAAAVISAVARGHPFEEATDLIPQFSLSPNPRMIQLADDELELGGLLVDAVNLAEHRAYGSSIYRSSYDRR